uniref:CCHC-type domain-containing protein n=1 Tax=Callorhinchus milii TaxID=7868 RepID=A0A4W3I0K3_CALMI
MNCFSCGAYGHWSQDCPTRSNDSDPHVTLRVANGFSPRDLGHMVRQANWSSDFTEL